MAKATSENRARSISEALKILSEAKRSKSRDLLSEDLKALKDLALEFFPELDELGTRLKKEVKRKAEKVKDAGEDTFKTIEDYLREQMKQHPLRVVTAAAVGGFILGILLGRRS